MRPAKLIIGFLLLVSLAGNVILYVKFRSRRPVIKVNGDVIAKKDITDYLEQQAGPNVKALLVERLLIQRDAQKQNLWPTEAEVNDTYSQKKELDWQFARRVNTNPWVEIEEKNVIQYDMARQRLLAKESPVDDAQMTEEYNQNKAVYDTPSKAKVHLAVLFKKAPLNDVRSMMEKNSPQVAPSEMTRSFAGQVVFLGDRDVFTVVQPFGQKPVTSQFQDVFNMKPGEVREFPAEELRSLGAQTILVRMVEIVPGKAADLNDPKVREKLRIAASLRRSKPWQEYLVKLWGGATFESVEPADRNYIELVFFPDRAAAQTPKE
jgi:hypothetical protein